LFVKGGWNFGGRFVNKEGLKRKFKKKGGGDFLYLLEENEMFIIAECWSGLQK
jgi:hypothetical protein